jgi:HipA-like C-terminal domain
MGSSSKQERPIVPTEPPRRFRRIGCRGTRWGLTRTLVGYRAAPDIGIGGKAPKWVLVRDANPEDFFIAKLGATNGRAETFTELFNNQLGESLGFEMAHSGVARLDSQLYFVTKNFRSVDERLVHGSLMIEEVFGAKRETERIHPRSEQAFYGIDFLKDVIEAFCKDDAAVVFEKFVEMLVFDALIGSMDRHAQNWGVLQKTSLPQRFRLAPIYDSARALLWLLPEAKLVGYDRNEAMLEKYIDASKPCIGPSRNHPKVNACNHFDVVENLMELYPHQTKTALAKISSETSYKAGEILSSFPYDRYMSGLRRKLILKVLRIRADRLMSVAGN